LVRGLEVAIVGNQPASDPPDSFDGIEFGGVGWQKNAYHAVSVAVEERLQLSCLVPTGVVEDKVELAASALKEITEEVAEGLGVEGGGLFGEKTSCFQVECPEVADLLTS
jgi:hypothetical protein